MTTSTTTLTDFLLARIEEDEAMARGASEVGAEWTHVDPVREPGRVVASGGVITYDEGAPNEAEGAHIARHDPARILADCKAKRDALDVARLYGCEKALAAILAQPYASHPDFRAEWLT